MAKKLEIKQCPGCGVPCELTAEYDAANGILVAIGDENTCQLAYFGGPLYRIVCMECETQLVSASIMGLPADTSVGVKAGPSAPITNMMGAPGRNRAMSDTTPDSVYRQMALAPIPIVEGCHGLVGDITVEDLATLENEKMATRNEPLPTGDMAVEPPAVDAETDAVIDAAWRVVYAVGFTGLGKLEAALAAYAHAHPDACALIEGSTDGPLVEIRMSPQLAAGVDAMATAQGCSRTEMVRKLFAYAVAEAVNGSGPWHMRPEP